MELNVASSLLFTLGHEGRLAVFRLLARRLPDGVRPSEIAEALGLKPNTLSVYVSALEAAGLISSHRQGRAVFYRAEMPAMSDLLNYLVDDCCRGRPELCLPSKALNQKDTDMSDAQFNVLFICTGNSARSIFAEALLAELGGDKFVAHSAGTRPYSELNPFAVELLQRNGHDISGLRSKNVSEFQGDDAPGLDFVFTVCDAAGNEECPPWEGQPLTAHWGLPDPVKVDGTDAEKSYAFANTYAMMRRRISAFVNLPFEQLDKMSLQSRLDEIGQIAPEDA
ncbi:ArsR family transcriptional regulator [Actibacterium mucosum KCTC 23349]|uniref:ArsR family transcriptional regulator n=1 Tax=Actibacterium mucosum KCTC 23349 TaxID=1454373 RepID=A0A037ZJ74_9RHOB|nr:helix-turn-helix domain-containing protein [Actibacterium mucosum]KAJ55607.1 ArsR family transcriptional regulator [Actibacterium mucosum KCTC 23349]